MGNAAGSRSLSGPYRGGRAKYSSPNADISVLTSSSVSDSVEITGPNLFAP